MFLNSLVSALRSKKRTKLQINDLDNDSLLLIFSRLPLHALLRLCLVCRRWNDLQPIACKQRRSLTLLIGNRKWYRSVQSNNPELDELVNEDGIRAAGWWSNYALVKKVKWPMKMPELSQDITKQFVEVFPNVTTLRVAQSEVSMDSIDQIVFMLEQWRHNLVTFKVMGFYKRDNKRKRNVLLGELFTAINNLSSLKRLTLHIFHHYGSTIDLPIVRQLEQFSFNTSDHVDSVLSAIKPHVSPDSKLTDISVKNILSRIDVSFDNIYQLELDLAHRFTELRINSTIELNKLQKFCSLFSNLKVLLCRVRSVSMCLVARAMQPLHQLECLHLCFEYPHPLKDPEAELPALPSVKGLSLELKLNSHEDINHLAIDRVFPNLQVIGLNHRVQRCTTCKINMNRTLGRLWHKRVLCAQRLAVPLKKCNSLERIYSDQTMFWQFNSRINVVNRNTFRP